MSSVGPCRGAAQPGHLWQATSGAFDAKNETFSVAGQSLNVDLANADPKIINANVFNLGNSILVSPANDSVSVSGSRLTIRKGRKP